MSNDKNQPAQSDAPQGGDKDTQGLEGIKQVQDQGMQEKGRQVDQTPQDVTGELDGAQPINRRA
ncbi:hypothetical protein DEDE109153_05290 [Deinococcus deserti]|uniref:Uncharacterized protein n=1 Tax=Deinococcus deserti (strain DSM 17065 / CIP 109153 / LMG 22923 / VCD115) TaxID=546414 RepID=C1D1D0_DEIDV|nr:hypothetical protein [Deinococcus deserti]ACO45654.1 hypothetical protein Deide_07900 [Deinococcus deserti VCD115]